MSVAPGPRAVAWIVPNYPWDGDAVSGIFYRNQALALARAGTDVTVLAPTPWAPWPLALLNERWARYRHSPRRQSDDGVDVVRPRYLSPLRDDRRLRPDRAIAASAMRVRAAWSGAELIHGHFSVAGIAAGHVARAAGLPYVLTMHGDDVNTWPDDRPEWREPLVASLRAASMVITVSEALGRRVRALSGVMAVPLPIGIDHRAFRSAAGGDREAARAELGLDPTNVVALFVGNLQAAKGIGEFVAGVEAAGDAVLGIVVGEGPARGTLEARASGRVRWLGRRANAEVARHMRAADVLVLPSHGEGLPTVVVEAGSLALPVIASRVGGIPELLDPGRGILLNEISAAAVADALRRVAADRPAAARMGEALRAHVETAYDVDINARRLADLYRDVVASAAEGDARRRGGA